MGARAWRVAQKLPSYMCPSAYVFLEAFPLTPNGKVDRKALPAPTPETLHPTHYVAPRTDIEKQLAGIWQDLLGVDAVGIEDNFFELGGDSILAIQIIARARKAGIEITPKELFQHQTIAALAGVVRMAGGMEQPQEPVIGPVPLTPIQRWFFEQDFQEPHHFNQAVLLELRQPVHPEIIQEALGHLIQRHDALRLRFKRDDATWRQEHAAPDATVPFTHINLAHLAEAGQREAIEQAANEVQGSLNLSEGPLLRVALLDLVPERNPRLLFVIHHLAVDGVSWRILLEDFQTACAQIGEGKTVSLPPKTTSFKGWSERLMDYARSSRLATEWDYWLSETRRTPCPPLPVDLSGDPEADTVAPTKTVSVCLDAQETRSLLQDVPGVYRTQINDVLLTALVQAFGDWTGHRMMWVDLEGHGREDIFEGVDLSRTVGWFTSMFPMFLDLRESDPLDEALKSVKEQLRAVPRHGLGYGVLRYLSHGNERVDALSSLPRPEVCFNYLGQFGQVLGATLPLAVAPESHGANRSPKGNRTHRIEINASVAADQLKIDWDYSERVHHRETIEGLAQGFIRRLRALIDHCLSAEAGGYTASDFEDAGLDQKGLDKLMRTLNKEAKNR